MLDQSNADAIAKAMEPFTDGDDPDVVMETHNHWAVGHVDGFSIRVYRDGEITEAFKTYHDLMEQLDGYPILDEEDYSEQGVEATLENISDAAWRVKHEYDLARGLGGRSLLLAQRQPPERRREPGRSRRLPRRGRPPGSVRCPGLWRGRRVNELTPPRRV